MVHTDAPVFAHARDTAASWSQGYTNSRNQAQIVGGVNGRLSDARCQCTTALLRSLGCTSFGSAVVLVRGLASDPSTISEAFLCSTAPSIRELALAETRTADANFGLSGNDVNETEAEIEAVDAIDTSVRLPLHAIQALTAATGETISNMSNEALTAQTDRITIWKLNETPRPASRIVLQVVSEKSDTASSLQHHVPPSVQAQVHAFLMGIVVLEDSILHRPAGLLADVRVLRCSPMVSGLHSTVRCTSTTVVTFDQESTAATPRPRRSRPIESTPTTTPAASAIANSNSGMWPPTPVPFNLDTDLESLSIENPTPIAGKQRQDIDQLNSSADKSDKVPAIRKLELSPDSSISGTHMDEGRANLESTNALTTIETLEFRDNTNTNINTDSDSRDKVAVPSPTETPTTIPQPNDDDHGDPVRALRELIVWPIRHRALVQKLGGVRVPKGILLVGAPGVGKTRAVRLLAQEIMALCPVDVQSVSCAQLFRGGGIGEGEARLRAVFAQAEAHASGQGAGGRRGRRRNGGFALSLVFLDEVDALCPPRESGEGGSDSRMVAQLLTLMDGVVNSTNSGGQSKIEMTKGTSAQKKGGVGEEMNYGGAVIVIGATNLPDSIDSALRRPGRFDHEVTIKPPTTNQRVTILTALLSRWQRSSKNYTGKTVTAEADVNGYAIGNNNDNNNNNNINNKSFDAAKCTVDLDAVAAECVGFVGADLEALVREAIVACGHRLQNQNIEHGLLSMATTPADLARADFDTGLRAVGEAAALRGVLGNVSKQERASRVYDWASVGGYEHVKSRLREAVEWPLQHSDALVRMGLASAGGAGLVQGVLLYGPPGCAKTSLVRAAAWAAQATLITLSGADVYSPFVGEAESTLRNAFKRAREALPAVLFFDEIDALVGKRDLEGGSGGNGGDAVQSRVLATFLNEMDGVDTHGGGLLVMAATNRPDCLDAALLRAGRFDVRILVGPPDSTEARRKILEVHTVGRSMPLHVDVKLDILAGRTEGLTGAELAAVCSEAAMLALRENVDACEVQMKYFEEVLRHVSPSVTPELMRQYQLFEDGGAK